MVTQRSDIRRIVDAAEEFLPATTIFSLMKVRCSRAVFGVTLAQMLEAKQVRKRKAPKRHREQGVRFVYGPGPKPVEDSAARERMPPRHEGFMARRRRLEAEANQRKAQANG